MEFFKSLGLDSRRTTIDWELHPAETFGMFESWGGKERIRNRNERFYYFYIDGWRKPARLLFMERGIKHARVLAHIRAPRELLDHCIAEQGKSTTLDAAYAIDKSIKQWLLANVLDGGQEGLVLPLTDERDDEPVVTGLPARDAIHPTTTSMDFRRTPGIYPEERLTLLIRSKDLYDRDRNPEGYCEKYLVDNGDGLTVTDLVTGLMWQRAGSEINSIRSIRNWITDLNEGRFAGYTDWRLPTTLEVLTLLEKDANRQGLFLPPCFGAGQPFIFTADARDPGGYWFVDFTKGSAFWASGFNPGGYGRVCRNIRRSV